jgi:hypothetical protein
MTKADFLKVVRSGNPAGLARRFLSADQVAAFTTQANYVAFKERVAQKVADAEIVVLAGSGNWGFSLDPDNAFKPFDRYSDLDVVVVSLAQFNKLWEEMRRLDRAHYWSLGTEEKQKLRRNGENVYAGFISPLWFPDRTSSMRIWYSRMFNELRDRSVEFRKVQMFFFKNFEEAVSYYERGFALAQRTLT